MSQIITKRELREQRRAERRAAEEAERARAQRVRRLRNLGIAVGLAVAVLAVAIGLSSNGGDPQRSPAQAAALFKGIPERNGVLGDPSAPVTVTEFVDLQCPICAQASQTTLPPLVRDHVRTGQVKLEARTLHFIGPDSVRAARVAAGAEQQGRLWPFLEAFYAAQKTENSGYVTDGFLRSVAADAGVNADRALAYADTAASEKPLTEANADASSHGIDATPTFTVRVRGDQKPQVVSAADLEQAVAVASRR
jgi:protein-disulfide isomerase